MDSRLQRRLSGSIHNAVTVKQVAYWLDKRVTVREYSDYRYIGKEGIIIDFDHFSSRDDLRLLFIADDESLDIISVYEDEIERIKPKVRESISWRTKLKNWFKKQTKR
jgi:hypothetical protein